MKKLIVSAVMGTLSAVLFTGCSHNQITVTDPKTHKKVKKKMHKIPNRQGESCPYQERTIEVFQHNGYGEFVACEDYVTVLNGRVSSGRPTKYTTPAGSYRIWQKRFEHDSTLYPSEDGTRNMDRAQYINGSIAIHKGNPYARSHGCIHVGSKKADLLYDWTDIGTKVVVTNI